MIITLFLSVCVLQLTPVGTTVFQGLQARDADAGVNGLVEYYIVPGNVTDSDKADGAGYFSINLPHQGQVTVNRSLDYERTQKYLVTVVASVSPRQPKTLALRMLQRVADLYTFL